MYLIVLFLKQCFQSGGTVNSLQICICFTFIIRECKLGVIVTVFKVINVYICLLMFYIYTLLQVLSKVQQ